MNGRRRAGAAGFTFVELLVALTLLGLLTMLVFGGVRLAARAWGRADERAADAADRWAVANVLRDAITAAYPAFASGDLQDRTIAFSGEAHALSLLAPLPRAVGAAVIAQMRFDLEGEGPSRTLVLGWRLDLPASENGGPLPENRVVLLEAVHRLDFAYFGADAPDAPPLWHERWAGRTTLPRLVKVRLVRSGGALPDWSGIVAAPRAMISTACILDLPAVGCRRVR